MNILTEITQEDINSSKSFTDLLRKFNYQCNGRTLTKIKKLLSEKFDTSNIDKYKTPTKYNKIEAICPICGSTFTTLKDHPRSKTTCSYACSNTYFRSGRNNGATKPEHILKLSKHPEAYRTLCFRYHKKECIICKEHLIVEVHHYDHNHENNEINNLVPLCPTHHKYVHSRHRQLIQFQIDKYVNDFIGTPTENRTPI